jgi:hypothetical protein
MKFGHVLAQVENQSGAEWRGKYIRCGSAACILARRTLTCVVEKKGGCARGTLIAPPGLPQVQGAEEDPQALPTQG